MSVLENDIPVFFHEINFNKRNIEEFASPLRVFGVLVRGTNAGFIFTIPIPHKRSDNIVTWNINIRHQ